MTLEWTSVDDVKGRWIGDDVLPATDEQIATLLADAEDSILREFPTIPQRVTDGDLPLARVKKVAARMVIRVLRNPEGSRTIQSTTGPYSENVTFPGSAPGEVLLTDEDRADLSPSASGGRAFTIDPTPASARGGYQWVSPTVWEPLP